MINMFNLNLFKNIGFLLYLFVYLIIPYSAITQTLKVDFTRNLENSLNARDLEFIRKNHLTKNPLLTFKLRGLNYLIEKCPCLVKN